MQSPIGSAGYNVNFPKEVEFSDSSRGHALLVAIGGANLLSSSTTDAVDSGTKSTPGGSTPRTLTVVPSSLSLLNEAML